MLPAVPVCVTASVRERLEIESDESVKFCAAASVVTAMRIIEPERRMIDWLWEGRLIGDSVNGA